jgi:cytochrome c oxidase subunit 2
MGGFDPHAAGEHLSMHHHSMPAGKGSAIAASLESTSEEAPRIALGIGASPANQGKAAGVNVNVLGLQYAWIFTYPNLNITSGELHVPVGEEVQLNITAQDVIHAVWIPELRLKQDAIPGSPTELRFTASKVGEYPLRCAELCGGYHGSMVTRMIVHNPEDYQTWVASQQPPTQAAQGIIPEHQHAIPSVRSAIAMNPAQMTPGQYLTPYAQEMGIQPEMLEQVKSQK